MLFLENQDLLAQEEAELDKLAYTKKRYLSPREIAAYVLVNFGQKNLSQFVSAYKEFFMIQFFKAEHNRLCLHKSCCLYL